MDDFNRWLPLAIRGASIHNQFHNSKHALANIKSSYAVSIEQLRRRFAMIALSP